MYLASRLFDSEVTVNGVRLHLVQSGPRSGKPVVLLHGWPEFWYTWRHQIGFLAEQGYRVTAPDQRGYNLSDKPKPVSAYGLNALAEDILGLINQLGHRKVHLVGHDLGGSVAWYFASNHPERLRSLTILNAPHHSGFLRAISLNPRQALRVRHMFYFQFPLLPEQLLRRGGFRALKRQLRQSTAPEAYGDEDLQKYTEAWSQPGAFSASLKWYRAALRSPPAKSTHSKIKIPTQVLWGGNDHILPPRLGQEAIKLCPLGKLSVIRNAGHFPHLDQPQEVNKRLAAFLEKN